MHLIDFIKYGIMCGDRQMYVTYGDPQPIVGNHGVYLVEGAGRYKIGWSKNVSKRLAAMQIGSPVKLKLLTVIDAHKLDERVLHLFFDEYRLHGEWFDLFDEAVGFLRSLEPSKDNGS